MFFLVAFLISLSVTERPKSEDFAAGYERDKVSMFNHEGMLAFALNENSLAVLKQPNVKLNKYIKYDPFLDLYLVRTDFSLIPTPVGDEKRLTHNDWIGIWDPNRVYIGHTKCLVQSIDERDQLDFSAKVGLLGTPCCEMMGIALNNSSFIGSRYLKHFTKCNDVYWSDIGADFTVREDKVYVNSVRRSGQFLVNDEIIGVDGTLAKDIRKLNEEVLFADRGGTFYFRVLQDNVNLNISTEIFTRGLNKFNLPGSKPKPEPTNSRSNISLSVDSGLVVTKVDADSKAILTGFMVGDKILRANNVTLKDFKELQALLGTGNNSNILIEYKSDKLPLLGLDNDLGGIYSGGDGKFQFFIRLVE